MTLSADDELAQLRAQRMAKFNQLEEQLQLKQTLKSKRITTGCNSTIRCSNEDDPNSNKGEIGEL